LISRTGNAFSNVEFILIGKGVQNSLSGDHFPFHLLAEDKKRKDTANRMKGRKGQDTPPCHFLYVGENLGSG